MVGSSLIESAPALWPRRASLALAVFALLGGAISLAGWAFDRPSLADWSGTGIAMQPNTALAAICVGCAVLFLHTQATIPSMALGALAAAIGASTLFQHLSGVDLGIDRLLLFEREWGSQGTVTPGRMGPPASTSWTLLGTGLVLAATRRARMRAVAAWLAGAAVLVGLFSVVGHVFGASGLYTLPRLTAIALQTATIVLCTAIALLFAMPERAPVGVLAAPSAGSFIARRALPFVIAFPIVLGGVLLLGLNAGHYDAAFGAALRTLVEICVLVGLLWWAVRRLNAHEKELRRHAAHLSAFLDTAAISLHRVGPDGTILWANDAELRTLGYFPEEYVGRNIAEFHVDQDVIADILTRLGRGESIVEREARLRCKDGSIKHVLIDSTALWEDGRFLHTQCFTRDITERRRLAEAQAALAAIVETSDDAIVSKSPDGTIHSWNHAAERLFGFTAAEAIGRSILMIIPEELHAQEQDILSRLRRGERIAHYETVRATKSGRLVDVSLSVSPVHDGAGNVLRISSVARDISERKATEAELRKHREELEQLVADRTAALETSHRTLRAAERMAALGTLSAGLGHDMGNILLPMRVRLGSLLEADLPPHLQEDLTVMRKATDYLQRLATGLRLVAQDPRAASPSECTELMSWWEDVKGVIHSLLPRGICLETRWPDQLCTAAISKAALTQAVFNLVQNAVDAMRERGSGNILIWAREGQSRLTVGVTDDGPGMRPEVRAHCLEPFFTTKPRGVSTGMGLTLVAGLLRSAGGRLEVESEIGKGTTFTLDLPRGDGPGVAPPDLPQRPARVSLRDPRLRSFVAGELRSLDYAVNAEDANHAPDICILDDASQLAKLPESTLAIFVGTLGEIGRDRVRALGEKPTISALRAAVREAGREAHAQRVGMESIRD